MRSPIEFRKGAIILRSIEESNFDLVRESFAATPDPQWILDELDQSYRPKFDGSGRRTLWGFVAELNGELAGLSLLGISSYDDARGYTGADTLVCMRGRGVAPGSKSALLYLGFEILQLNRIETGCFVSNLSSRRSIEKTPGFEFEGTLREYAKNDRGEFEDERRYAILRRDWERLYRREEIEVFDPILDS